MTRQEELIRLACELEEAKNWAYRTRSAGWADEWAEDVERQIALLKEEQTPAAVALPIRRWPKYCQQNLRRSLSLIMILCFFTAPAQAASISGVEAVRAILGEAEGEGARGMYAVACAIRNRGHLGGVYGLRAVKHSTLLGYFRSSDGGNRKIDAKVIATAERAWEKSRMGSDITGGANSWENVKAFGMPYWARGLEPTCVIGSHAFYKVDRA